MASIRSKRKKFRNKKKDLQQLQQIWKERREAQRNLLKDEAIEAKKLEAEKHAREEKAKQLAQIEEEENTRVEEEYNDLFVEVKCSGESGDPLLLPNVMPTHKMWELSMSSGIRHQVLIEFNSSTSLPVSEKNEIWLLESPGVTVIWLNG